MVTRSKSYYDVDVKPLDSEDCTITLKRRPSEKEIVHTPEEYDFADALYQDYRENAEAYEVVSESGELKACIEVCRRNGQTGS